MNAYVNNNQHVPLEQMCQFEPIDRLDSDQNIFYARELEHILVELTEFQQARITHREFFPIDTSAGPTAETITWRQITRTGIAKIIANYGDEIPTVNVFTEERSSSVRSQAISAVWSLQEIRASKATGKPLDREQAISAREAHMRQENSIAFNGDAKHGLVGLFSAGTSIPFTTVVGGIWTSKTPQAVFTDMADAAKDIVINTGDNEAPQTMALPIEQFDYIHQTNMGNGTDKTIAQYFLEVNPYIERFTRHRELAGKGPSGEDVLVAYDFNKRKIQLNVPLDLEQLPPERSGLETSVIYHMRQGGITVRRPLSLNMKFGI